MPLTESGGEHVRTPNASRGSRTPGSRGASCSRFIGVGTARVFSTAFGGEDFNARTPRRWENGRSSLGVEFRLNSFRRVAEKNCSGHLRKLGAKFGIAEKEMEAAENGVYDTRHETSHTENRTATINPPPKSGFRRCPFLGPHISRSARNTDRVERRFATGLGQERAEKPVANRRSVRRV